MRSYAYSGEMVEEFDEEEAQSLCRGSPKGDISLVKQERKEKNVENNDIEDDAEEDKREWLQLFFHLLNNFCGDLYKDEKVHSNVENWNGT